jgi:Domain of unknown function (DUF4286)
MIVYNVTITVDLNISELWVKWMKEEHIPRVMETGCFKEFKFYRIMEDNQSEGMTYAVQYFATELSHYFDYQEKHALRLQKESKDTWPDKYTAFRTLLREI